MQGIMYKAGKDVVRMPQARLNIWRKAGNLSVEDEVEGVNFLNAAIAHQE
jgi:hypothetical protein